MCDTLWGDKVEKSTVSLIEGGETDRGRQQLSVGPLQDPTGH